MPESLDLLLPLDQEHGSAGRERFNKLWEAVGNSTHALNVVNPAVGTDHFAALADRRARRFGRGVCTAPLQKRFVGFLLTWLEREFLPLHLRQQVAKFVNIVVPRNHPATSAPRPVRVAEAPTIRVQRILQQAFLV